jgi:hypothetical protein
MTVSRALVLICAFSLACATSETVLRLYPGSPRPTSEIAVLKNKAGNLWAVDGVNPRCGTCQSTSLELLPGTHTVSVEIGGAGTGVISRTAGASFEAVAGHTYELSARIVEPGSAEGTWTPVVKDVTLGTTVFP